MGDKRVNRVIRLLTILQSRRVVSIDYLAQTFKCTRRSIFRDFEDLRNADIAITFDKKSRTYIFDDPALARPRLNSAEWRALLLSAASSPIAKNEFFKEDLRQSIDKLMAYLSSASRASLSNLLSAYQSSFPNEIEPTPPVVFGMIMEAVAGKRYLNLEVSEGSELCRTKFGVYAIVFDVAEWVIRGESSLHGAVTSIGLGCVRTAQMTDENYSIPRNFWRIHSAERPSQHRSAETRPAAKSSG